jgi:hypothetical protein
MLITIDILKEDIPFIQDALQQRASRYGADSKRCSNGYGTATSQQKALDLEKKQAKVLEIFERIYEQTYDY